jgi:hypothetical protein
MEKEIKTKAEYFSKIVRRYCDWAENPAISNEIDFQTAQRILAELFLSVLDLPDGVFEDDVKLESVSIEEWKAIRERFSNLPVNGYWIVFDPTQAKENDTVFALLSDDLADIYQDIKYGLLLFHAGHIEEAIWQWKFNFKIHWGRHLLNAQKVIYSWNFNNGEL